MASLAKSKPDWTGVPIESIIDRELGRNPDLRSGLSAYAAMIAAFQSSGDGEQLLNDILDHAAQQYRGSHDHDAELLTFGDGACNYLFDLGSGPVKSLAETVNG